MVGTKSGGRSYIFLGRMGWPRKPRSPQEGDMGEIKARVSLENLSDRVLYESGKKAKKRIRRAEVDAIVDTGAIMTLLPQELVEKLGLTVFDTVTVTLADESRVRLKKAGPLNLTIGDRPMITDCLVGPLGCDPLIGQIVMEELDLICDPGQRTLTPRPESPFSPTLKMKVAATLS